MRHASGCAVIFDAYNANPASMRASVEAFCQEFAQRPKILVLGDMKELGAESKRFHQELGGWLATLPLKSVYLAGPERIQGRAVPAPYAKHVHLGTRLGTRHGIRPEDGPRRRPHLARPVTPPSAARRRRTALPRGSR